MDKSEKECPVCHGSRYKNHVLKYLYNQKNIVDIMDMTILEAVEFFENKKINKVLKNLTDVGLGYLTLGQSLDTVSGGEAQRLKLAKELNNKGNIYILDEPTSGLHSSDIKNIIKIIDSLVDRGNTAIVIEHNTDIMRSSDWIIDLGPLGGNKGGNIIFEGRPKDLFNCKQSNTAKYI